LFNQLKKNMLKIINTHQGKRKAIVKSIFITLIISIILFSLLTQSHGARLFNNNNVNISTQNNDLKIEGFLKENFEQILTQEKQALGTINITDIFFEEQGFRNYSLKYPSYDQDFYSDALNVSSTQIEFIRTIREAVVDNIDEDIEDFNKTTILLNETIEVKYNKSKSLDGLDGYVIYGPRLNPCLLKQLFIKNGTNPSLKEVNAGNYSIDENNFLLFNYDSYFKGVEAVNFSMYLIWEYNMTINNWDLVQLNEGDLLLTESEQEVTAFFEYFFNIKGSKFNGTSLQEIIPATNLHVYLKIILPDMALLDNFTVQPQDYLESSTLSGGAFNVHFTSSNDSLFFVNFTADFTLSFFDPVKDTWAIDRLVGQRNLRERIYFPSIISGPRHIYLKFIKIHETTISITQVQSTDSLFNRKFTYIDKNLTEFEGDVQNSLVFTENVVKKRGLEIQLPFMIRGETCPFSIFYKTIEDLRVIITDNINMPITGLQVKIDYYGKEYGTYISNNRTQPLGPIFTNENGEFSLTNVSNGNYLIKIYQNNVIIANATVSSYRDINYVITTIPHFPYWLIIYSSMNGAILLTGVYLYLKNKRKASY